MKPRLFIGSSSEGIDIAYAIQENLDKYAEVTVWSQGVFGLSKTTIESLMKILDLSDFGIFIFSPDDIVKIRGEETLSIRDNVVFELGLFFGRLGRERCFIAAPKNGVFRLPTDLLGVSTAQYDSERNDNNLLAGTGPACNKIRKVIQELGPIRVVEQSFSIMNGLDEAMQKFEELVFFHKEIKTLVLCSDKISDFLRKQREDFFDNRRFHFAILDFEGKNVERRERELNDYSLRRVGDYDMSKAIKNKIIDLSSLGGKASSSIEIKLYDAFPTMELWIFDNKKIIIGLLQSGKSTEEQKYIYCNEESVFYPWAIRYYKNFIEINSMRKYKYDF